MTLGKIKSQRQGAKAIAGLDMLRLFIKFKTAIASAGKAVKNSGYVRG